MLPATGGHAFQCRSSAWNSSLTIILLLSVAAFLVQSWSAALQDSQTSDEAVHLAAGLSYWRTADYRMNPEHPPLSKLISATPLLWTDAKLPVDDPSWDNGWEWTFGTRFLYFNNLSPAELLNRGRIPMLIAGALLVVLIVMWSYALYGNMGAILAGTLAAFEPNLIAHSHYVTNDLLFALFYTSSLFSIWQLNRSQSKWWLLGSGITVGMMLATKYSGLALIPLLPILLWPTGRPCWQNAAKQVTTRLLVIALLSYGVLAVAYQGEPLEPFIHGYSGMQSSWNSFLMGQVSEHGWYHYFIVALLLKTPPATVILLIGALVSIRRWPLQSGEGFLLFGAGWFLLVSSVLRINIGIRHILPVICLLLIFAGRVLVPQVLQSTRLLKRGAIFLLGLTTMIEVAAVHPFYLSYFSSLVGGPWAGYRYLSDSNLDWGQDMGRLSTFLQDAGQPRVLLGVFSNARPERLGLEVQPLPQFGTRLEHDTPLEPFPDRVWLAMSALNLQGVYFTRSDVFSTRVPIDQSLYAFLLERRPLKRLTPSIWIWDLTNDAEALYRLGSIYLNFGWLRSAIVMFERYLILRPDDAQAYRGLGRLREALSGSSGPTQE